MSFRLQGLDPVPFRHLYGLPGADLALLGVRRVPVTATPGAPDRIEMRDMDPGETALLFNYEHQPAPTAYRAAHAIFIREGAENAYEAVDTIPEVMRIRPISLRAFSAGGDMIDADLADGRDLAPLIERFLARSEAAYLHAHYAKRGCYAALITRA